ncbi:MAG: hypothetical protein L3J73_05545 [Thermoplasmata archaeon]|nr:hypothetical protein [Thermoplasmata archaeon]
MALFSDIDWTILLAVAGFLVLGKEGGTVLRQIGRFYGRMMRIKSELLSDFAKAADLPAPIPGRVVSIRQSLLHWEPGYDRNVSVPIAVTTPPVAAVAAYEPMPTGGSPGLGPSTWSVSYPHASDEARRNA